MTPGEVTQLVGSVGFPGALVLYLIWYLTKSLNGKLDRLTTAVEKNTEATQDLATSISRRSAA